MKGQLFKVDECRENILGQGMIRKNREIEFTNGTFLVLCVPGVLGICMYYNLF